MKIFSRKRSRTSKASARPEAERAAEAAPALTPAADRAPSPAGVDQEVLGSLLDALEVVRVDLAAGQPEALATTLRLVQSLYGLVRQDGHEALKKTIEAVEEALTEALAGNEAADLLARLDDLLASLRTLVERTEQPHAHILIVEPDPDEAALLQVILNTPHRDVEVVHTAAEAEARLAHRPFDLIVTELLLPDMDGRNLLVRLRGRSATAATPVYILSRLTQPQIKAECFALGADAFFEKPYDPAAFAAAISARLQRRHQRDTFDPVTGLPDRTGLQEAFSRAVTFYDLTTDPLCVALIDLDNFTVVNDLYGPATGDDVLQKTADLIRASLRDLDLLGRWERDTFCALLPETTPQEAARLLDRALQAVRNEPFYASNDRTFHVSFSAAITTVHDTERSLEETLREARRLLTSARQIGPGQIVTEDYSSRPARPSILLIEDDEDIAAIIQFRLQRDGYDVTHCNDGQKGIDFARQNTVSLIILDVKMPGLDGFEVLDRLRKMPAHARTPVIMLTSMGREDDVVRGFELGADDYVLKPFSPVELSARVRRLLHRHGHRAAVSAHAHEARA
ncbi:MAG: hypothetical protein KatS3mg042_0765 [Rhodothermaceae bacterium]|nr:MAG: hypothetical protein KatS3mg042_0765 [Rhodothermaceae bacterium]